MTKITIISGFLGAGKTTLIKKLLSEAYEGEKVVLIENEFGEIGIDGGFLKDFGIEVTEMNSGCICCSLSGDFGEALKEVLKTYSPDRILIEPSGVGKLSDVITAVKEVEKEVNGAHLHSCITVVDAGKCRLYMKNFGEFFNNQIEYAKAIILSRTQNMQEERLKACVDILKEHNESAAIVTTPWEELDGKVILKAMEKGSNPLEKELLQEVKEHGCGCGHSHDHEHEGGCGCGHSHDHEHGEGCGCGHSHDHEHGEECGCGHSHHHGDEIFTSWGVETPRQFRKEELDEILETLSDSGEYGTVLRAKGIVAGENGRWLYFDMVPGELEIREGEADYTGKICVIGTELVKDGLETLFRLS